MTPTVTEPREGAANPPQNPSASKATPPSGAAEADHLTPEGVASLLSSAFAQTEKAETDAGQTVLPETESAASEPAALEATAEEPAEKAGEGESTPEALQTAIDQWEERGGELPGALQKLVDKRIGKLTAQRESEKARAEAAQAETERLKAENAALRTSGQRGSEPTLNEKQLGELETVSQRFVNDVEAFLDGDATEEEAGRVQKFMEGEQLDQNKLRRRLRETKKFLGTVPQRRESIKNFQAEAAKAEPVVKQYFPWLDDPSSPEHGIAQQVVQYMPELATRTPNHRMAMGVWVLGVKAFQALTQSGNGAAKATPKAPPKAPVAGSSAPVQRPNGKAAAEESARQEFAKKPTRESVANLLRNVL